MVQAMVLGGLRRCEVLGLRLEDLRLGEWRVFIADGKGGHQRLVPVSKSFFATVADYLNSERPADAVTDRVFVALKGPVVSKTTVQKLLVDAGMGRRCQRVARSAALAALVGGLVTEPVVEEVFGFCHWAARPGDLVALDSFYIGKLKGVGKVYQLTAVDTATRWAMVRIVLSPVTAEHTCRFIAQVQRRFLRLGWPVLAVLSDNGPEYVAIRFRSHLSHLGLAHHRIPPRTPTTTPCANASRAPPSRSAGARRSTTDASGPSASFRPRPMLGCRATTTVVATTATSCGVERPAKCSTVTTRSEQHDHQPQRPSVTSNPSLEGLEGQPPGMHRRCHLASHWPSAPPGCPWPPSWHET